MDVEGDNDAVIDELEDLEEDIQVDNGEGTGTGAGTAQPTADDGDLELLELEEEEEDVELPGQSGELQDDLVEDVQPEEAVDNEGTADFMGDESEAFPPAGSRPVPGPSDEPEVLEEYEEDDDLYELPPTGRATGIYDDEDDEADSDEEDPIVSSRPSASSAATGAKTKGKVQQQAQYDLPCMILQHGDVLYTVFSNPPPEHPVYEQFAELEPIFEGRGDLFEGVLAEFLMELKESLSIDKDTTLEFPDLDLSFGQDSKYLTQARLVHLQTFHVSLNLSRGISRPLEMFPLKMVILEHRGRFEKQWNKLLALSKIGNSSENPIVLDSEDDEPSTLPQATAAATSSKGKPAGTAAGLFAGPRRVPQQDEKKGLSHPEEIEGELEELDAGEQYEINAPKEPEPEEEKLDADQAELLESAPLGGTEEEEGGNVVQAEEPSTVIQEQEDEGGIDEFLRVDEGDVGDTLPGEQPSGLKRKQDDDEEEDVDQASKRAKTNGDEAGGDN